ncbi:uncharacterized protein Bfra_011381 [Botrytis fragariae]|uniref:Uncharacterized protein n=1 Tax=Botrytis fragariae TaxID=1964551 RepID=A0A8H6AXM7_9HELO|nr:uncharacterized protein Bfra_011381 [Botrytis fragariae]KAF5875619.1 hypothetical protein Bfra_011381 [Botrytis fragariae]
MYRSGVYTSHVLAGCRTMKEFKNNKRALGPHHQRSKSTPRSPSAHKKRSARGLICFHLLLAGHFEGAKLLNGPITNDIGVFGVGQEAFQIIQCGRPF